MKPALCQRCPLEREGEGYAPGEGPDDATVLLLGEALGAEEAQSGRPFVGGAGQVLNALLRKANLRRSHLYITNVVRCRPPGNRTPTEQEAHECMQRHNLAAFLQRFNLIVLLGGVPLQMVTGRKGPTTWRGSLFEHEGKKYLATLHPAYVMRQQEMFPIAVADLTRIQQEGWTPDYTPPRQDYVLEADESHLRTYGTQPFAFDVETAMALEPAPGSVTILGLSQTCGVAHVFHDILGLRTLLQNVFASPVLKIGHNIMFDVRHMEAQDIHIEGPLFDTLVAHHLVMPDAPNDLGFCGTLYTRLPYWKHLMQSAPELYNATDADATYQIYDTLAPEIKQKGLTRVFNTSMAVLPVLRRMTERGIGIDLALQTKWRVGLERVIQRKEQELLKSIGDPLFNWRSPAQLSVLLYDKLKLPRYYSKHRQSVTTNEQALEDLLDQTGNPLLRQIIELRHLHKLASTYFSHPETPDSRVHCQYLLHGTATGRLSSREPNLQNVPKGAARNIFEIGRAHV